MERKRTIGASVVDKSLQLLSRRKSENYPTAEGYHLRLTNLNTWVTLGNRFCKRRCQGIFDLFTWNVLKFYTLIAGEGENHQLEGRIRILKESYWVVKWRTCEA